MTELYEKIGYVFRDAELIRCALTHPSCMNGRDYQRLEFLGDAVLELMISDYLYRKYPDMREGELTRARARIVCEETLSRAAESAGLSPLIRMGRGEALGGGRHKSSILCDVFESVLGAIYLDGGRERAQAFADRFLGPFIESADLKETKDPKTTLQELLQKQALMPTYVFLSSSGPAHDPRFVYAVECENERLGEGEGRSKQEAQREAARQALERLKQECRPN